jgi:hypothetical protein
MRIGTMGLNPTICSFEQARVKMKHITMISLLLISCLLFSPLTFAADSSGQRNEWEKTVEAAKKEVKRAPMSKSIRLFLLFFAVTVSTSVQVDR